MYGTIARLTPLPDRMDELVAYGREMSKARMPGYRTSFLFTPNESPYGDPTLFMVAIFDDRATYEANAESPEQNERYMGLRALLAKDPDWMDGTFELG